MRYSIKLISIIFIFVLIFASCTKTEDMDKSKSAKVQESRETAADGSELVFSTKDLNGNTVTNEIFSKYDLTLVNVWGTFCGPCKAELPDLETVYKEYSKKNCNVIAITIDLFEDDEGMLELAKEIWHDLGCSFPALYSNEAFHPILEKLAGVPTTFFIDKKGNIIKDSFHTGRLSESGFKKLFEENLAKVK